MSTIMVAGMVAAVPQQAGASWTVLQYVLGLRRLGHETLLVEEMAPDAVRPLGAPVAESENGRWFAQLCAELGLTDACLLVSGTSDTAGMSYLQLLETAGRTDCLLNLSGVLTDPNILNRADLKVYLDLDPAFTQLWEMQGHDLGLDGHDRFATVGLTLGHPDCRVPGTGRDWITTVPPVALDHWPPGDSLVHQQFTTVGNWRSYGSVEHEGVFYGQKVHSMRSLIDLPGRCNEGFLLAMDIHPDETAELDRLVSCGWELVPAAAASSTLSQYRDFIAGSKAEFGLAKSGYVLSRCGWFSDRTACYLASGRPAVIQDTGIGSRVPTGEGLVTFSDTAEAAAGVAEVAADYERHSKAARAFAERYLDSDRVLPALLDRAAGAAVDEAAPWL